MAIYDAFFVNGKFVPQLLGEFILEQNSFITLRESEETFVLRDGYYQPFAKSFIEERCNELLAAQVSDHYVLETLHYIKRATYSDVIEPPLNLINLENGVLDRNTLELTPHEQCPYAFFQQLPVRYDPKATCPNIDAFIIEVVDNENDRNTLYEVPGFCLKREYKPGRALMLIGKTQNGKTTYLLLITAFLGLRNIASKTLQRLITDKFSREALFGKLANISAELPAANLTETEGFKTLTGGDVIDGEKKFKNSFNFFNYAKLLFACNKLPEVPENESLAYFQRWTMLQFIHTFEGDKCKPHILDTLTTPEELSGFLNKALKGLKRLEENGDFSHKATIAEKKKQYVSISNPSICFIEEFLDFDIQAKTSKKDLGEAFDKYCIDKNLPNPGYVSFFIHFSKYIKEHGLYIGELREGTEGRVLSGVALLKEQKVEEKGALDQYV